MTDSAKPDVRAGEQPRTRFRAPDRCFRTDDVWYVATREGINVGPYDTQTAARSAAERLVRLLRANLGKSEPEETVRKFAALSEDPWPGSSPP